MSDQEQTGNVLDLFRQIALAKARMSLNNPHRDVLIQCEACIWQLSKELYDLKHAQQAAAEGVPV